MNSKNFVFVLILCCSFYYTSFSQQTLKVSGRHITTPCGDTVLLRGINKMNIWNDVTGETSMPEISKSGANAVRIVWLGTGKGRASGTIGSAEQLDKVITNCINQGMIPIPECHDATGDSWDVLPDIIDYWTRPDVVAVLKKHEAYSIINIANEAGVDENDTIWFNTYKKAISDIRATGLKQPLMIDGDHWGQNTTKLFQFGKQLLEHDPLHNLIFSFHPWWPSSSFGTVQDVVAKIDAELEKSITLNLPLIIGEFAHHAPGCALEIPHKQIMEMCHWKKISWLAWSWGPGNSDCRDMDMTVKGTFETFKHDSWAGDVLSGYYGLKRTSVKTDYITHKGECAPYCSKPVLPTHLFLCENETIELKNPLNTNHFSSNWIKNGSSISTNASVKIASPGTYVLEVDSSGCKKQTEVIISNQLPKPVFSNTIDLCNEADLLLSVPSPFENVNYNWLKDGKTISTNSVLSIQEEGVYQLVSEKGNCKNTSNQIKVSSPFLTIKNKTLPFEGEVYLKVKGGSGKYAWYKQAKGGSIIETGNSLTTYVTNTTTFYIEDTGEQKCKRTPVTVTIK